MTSKKLTPEQIDEFKHAFEMFDVNGDGCISAAELKTIMKQFNFAPSEEDISQMMKYIDTDKSGTIELTEFINFLENKMTGPEDQTTELIHAFKLFDKDGNGLITKEELREGFQKFGQKFSENDLNQLLDAADIDGDGNINFEEFVELMKYK